MTTKILMSSAVPLTLAELGALVIANCNGSAQMVQEIYAGKTQPSQLIEALSRASAFAQQFAALHKEFVTEANRIAEEQKANETPPQNKASNGSAQPAAQG